MDRSGVSALFAGFRHSPLGTAAAIVLAVLALPLTSGHAISPDSGASLVAPRTFAALSREGGQVLLTGSVADLFNSGFFAGPNRGEKVNRARLTPDGVTISGGFELVRMELAEARAPRAPDGTAVAPPIAIAAINAADSAALGAIDQIIPMGPGAAIMPISPSLAYAQASTPATVFDSLVDKQGRKISEKELWCMATAIYFEARGESYRGQIAVGQVVMNRVAHRLYPDTICTVVFQNEHMRNACQFSFACDGIPERVTEGKAWAQAQEIAKGVVNGSLYLAEVGKATHYHANYVYPHWAPRLKRLTKIGAHIFYQFKRA
jgi:hypothetical protein